MKPSIFLFYRAHCKRVQGDSDKLERAVADEKTVSDTFARARSKLKEARLPDCLFMHAAVIADGTLPPQSFLVLFLVDAATYMNAPDLRGWRCASRLICFESQSDELNTDRSRQQNSSGRACSRGLAIFSIHRDDNIPPYIVSVLDAFKASLDQNDASVLKLPESKTEFEEYCKKWWMTLRASTMYRTSSREG